MKKYVPLQAAPSRRNVIIKILTDVDAALMFLWNGVIEEKGLIERRADTSRNRNTGGTGLGLYIVRKIMEMHHAKYSITNTSNGVMFWFELPCKQPIDNSI